MIVPASLNPYLTVSAAGSVTPASRPASLADRVSASAVCATTIVGGVGGGAPG